MSEEGGRERRKEGRKGELLIDDPCWPGSPLLVTCQSFQKKQRRGRAER